MWDTPRTELIISSASDVVATVTDASRHSVTNLSAASSNPCTGDEPDIYNTDKSRNTLLIYE